MNKPHVFISAKESAEVSQEVMRRGREFLATMDDQQILALDGKYLVRSSNGQTYYLVDLKCQSLRLPGLFLPATGMQTPARRQGVSGPEPGEV